MKSVDFLKALGGVVCVVVACNAYAQSSDAMAASGTMSAAPSAQSTKKADRSLGLAVRKALAKSVDVSSIAVRARGGVVTLTGSVPDASQIEKAGTAAQGVSGVTSVNNKLSVQAQ